jgi:hypothetical protein
MPGGEGKGPTKGALGAFDGDLGTLGGVAIIFSLCGFDPLSF